MERPVADTVLDCLPLERAITGPAIIEEAGATTIVPPEFTATVDALGCLLLDAGHG